jgi:hypothetical protein
LLRAKTIDWFGFSKLLQLFTAVLW